jgi:hypothetical protein
MILTIPLYPLSEAKSSNCKICPTICKIRPEVLNLSTLFLPYLLQSTIHKPFECYTFIKFHLNYTKAYEIDPKINHPGIMRSQRDSL